MEPPQKKQRLDPPPQNIPSQNTFTDAYGNDLLSNFDGSGISNPGGNFHVAGNVHINSNASPQPPAANDNRQVLLESLRFDQIDARHDSIKRAHAKTCRWFPDTDVYKKWEAKDSSDVNNFLWIKGKPGAGKSTLMKFLHGQIHTRTRRKNKNEILISFFFNARGHELEKSTFGLYRSLLWQLLDKMPDLQRVLDGLRPGHQWTDERLKSLIEDAMKEAGDTPIFCLIDALDECDQDQIRDMVGFLEALVDVQSSLRVCFASRHYPHITVQTSHEIILEERDGHEKDIATYLSSALHITPKALAEQIRSEMQEKAHGVFMWVVLVVDILNKEFDSGRKYRLRERLKELPGDLHLLFRDILTRDTNNQANLLLCIQWVLFAKEPLTPRQLHLAILSGTEPDFLPHCHSEPILEEDVQRYILDNSKGLAQSTKSKVPTVQFIHESVRDFLLKGNGLGELFSSLESNVHGESHEALKDCCLAYITMKPLMELKKSSSTKAAQEFPFLEYANSGVLYHSNEAGLHGIRQDDFLAMFPLSQWVEQHNIIEKFENRKYTSTVSLFYILAEAGLPGLIRAHSDRQSCFEFEPERYGVPILAALALKHEPTVQVMLELQAERISGFDFADFCERLKSVETKSQSSSRAFKVRQNRKVVEQLLEHGDERILLFFLETTDYDSWSQGVNDCSLLSLAYQTGKIESVRHMAQVCSLTKTTKRNEAPLHRASRLGAFEAAKVLISRGADLNAKTGAELTPLHYAASYGHLEIAKLLIDCGADVSVADYTGDTPLHDAAQKGHLQLAQLLLDHGASVLAFNNTNQTPLHKAAGFGDPEIAKLLVNYGADVSVADNTGDTPLHKAAQKGHLQLAQLLLDHGASVLAFNNTNQTPLHKAAGFGDPEIAKLLVDCGANVSVADNTGDTPLHKAAQKGHLQLAQLLLDHGASVLAFNNTHQTPLHKAAYRGRIQLVQLLLDYGVYIQAVNKSGTTPLHEACRGGELEVTQLLIDRGADVLAKTNDGKTPLHYAFNEKIAGLLLDHGADIYAVDDSKETPLHKACQGHCDQARIKTVKLLIENKADPSAATDNGETPLHKLLSTYGLHIYEEERLEISKILVNSGADVSCPDKTGRTPLQLASSRNHWKSIAEFLQSRVFDSSSSAAHVRIEGPLQSRSPSNQRQLQRDDLLQLG